MKFYNMMKEHEDDLSRIIVSHCMFMVGLRSHSGTQTLENGKTLAEAKVGPNRCSELILVDHH